MHPEEAANHLYKELIGVYEGIVFVGWRHEDGVNALVVYVEHDDDPRFRLPCNWAGYPVEVKSAKSMLSADCPK